MCLASPKIIKGIFLNLFSRASKKCMVCLRIFIKLIIGFFARIKNRGFVQAIADLCREFGHIFKSKEKNYARLLGYSGWVDLYDNNHNQETPKINPEDPLISIILPTYNTPAVWLRKCIDSVSAQLWPQWELCIVDDASTHDEVRQILLEYADRDARIRIHFRENNGHISIATNDALQMATGEFIVLLDHDDELRPHSLLEIVKALRKNPNLDFIYTDEDKIDENNRRFDPYFKPDWNPDLLLSRNYICHMVAIRKNLVLDIGGMRSGYEGSQDHDLFLRCTRATDPSRIYHIPKILYHWRSIEGSTAHQIDSKSYAIDAGLHAISDHLQSLGSDAKVTFLPPCSYRVIWPITHPQKKVSLIIPSRDRVDLLKTAVTSILDKTTYQNYEIIIADNQSKEDATLAYFDIIKKSPNIKIIPYEAPFNYSALNNHIVEQLKDTDVIGLINNDIEVITGDWLDEMVGHAIRPDIGAVGAMLYYPDNTIQHAGVILGMGGVAGHINYHYLHNTPVMGGRLSLTQNLSAVTAACLLIKRERYLDCGGLDAENLPIAFNDVDLCLKLQEVGYRNIWTPFAKLYHHESVSRGHEDTPEKQARFESEMNYMLTRWGKILRNDPAYNPNLSFRGPSYAFPPRTIS